MDFAMRKLSSRFDFLIIYDINFSVYVYNLFLYIYYRSEVDTMDWIVYLFIEVYLFYFKKDFWLIIKFFFYISLLQLAWIPHKMFILLCFI